MAYELIKVEETHDSAVTEIILGPPPANILSAKMMDEISTQLDQDSKNPNKKLVIFSGEGKHFSFGAAVEEHKPDQVGNMLPAFHTFIGNVIKCPVPTMAKVTGLCLGGSFEFAMACSFIFADETAKFGVPEIQLGVFPPVACALIPVLTSEQFSSLVILTGDQFSAQELYHRGMASLVSEAGKLDEAISTFFEKHFKPKSASSIQTTHKGCRMVLNEHYNSVIGRLEKLYLEDLMSTHDAKEGINAFLEKRKPEWKNE